MSALRFLRFSPSCSRRALSLLASLLFLAAGPRALASYRVELDAPDSLRDLLAAHLDLVRYQERDDLNEDQFQFMLDTAAAQVTRLASTEGYFQPQTELKVDRDSGTTVVRLKVAPGARTVVGRIAVRLSGAASGDASRAEQAGGYGGLRPGSPFRQEDWAAAKQAGLQELQQRRYPAARIARSQARIDPEQAQADLEIDYDSGPPFTFGELRIRGTERYPDSIVRNVSPLRPDEEYSADRLLELQHQIQRTPYFSNVVVDIDKDPGHAHGTPVDVRVTEFPAHRVRAGAGYATDTGAHLEGRYSYYNLFDRAWVLDAQTRLEQRRQSGALELAMPPGTGAWVNSGHGSVERTTLEGIDLRSKRIGLRRTRTSDRDDFSYTLEYYSDRLLQQGASAPPADTVVEPGTHSALVAGVALTRRRVDNPLFPRHGYIASIEAGAALHDVLTDQSFFRLYGRMRQYRPVGRRDLIVARGELGAVVSRGGNAEIPASLLFRAGGADSVRGYSYQSIGNERNGTVYPTRYLVTGGIEYQHWMSEKWGGALFYDAGAATDRWSGKNFFHAVGIGARWRSPVGPVNGDLAYGFQGGNIRPHLSLGIVF